MWMPLSLLSTVITGYPACSVQDFKMVVTSKSALSPWKMLSATACADSAVKRSSGVAASNALMKGVTVFR
jgi:hypothetical protein